MPKIINLRGTSGAGKSHLVKELMSRYAAREPEFVEGRKQPIGYLCHRPGGLSLYVVGHYEIACGGADTISKELEVHGNRYSGLDLVYHLVTTAASLGYDVIYEGLVVSSDVHRCIALSKLYQLLVIELNTPLAMCNAAVEDRRAEKAAIRGYDAKPLVLGRDGTPKHSQAKFKALITQRPHFRNAGVDFRHISRAEALDACLSFLQLTESKTALGEVAGANG
jgi:hypothetical protein